MLPRGSIGLLIADECHRCGSEQWSRALGPDFERRLGLTATYERKDNGVAEYLDPYFGGLCYTLEYGEALNEDIIASFKVAFIKVALNYSEQMHYEDYSEDVRQARIKLTKQYGVEQEPFGAFMRTVNEMTKSLDQGERWAAKKFLSAFAKRRDILANCEGKLAALEDVTGAVLKSDRTLLFAQTVSAQEAAVTTLRDRGISATAISGKTPSAERSQALRDFECGRLQVLAAPRILDEGIDVPSADLAVVMAASQSRIQMVQRMGRVLRQKLDRRLARLAIFCVAETSEDPDMGGHEAFLDMILPFAHKVEKFKPGQARELCEFLNDFYL